MVVILVLIWCIGSLIWLFSLWNRFGRDDRFHVAAPEYDSPEKLRPLELALVMGWSGSGHTEVNGRVLSAPAFSATIVDLIGRGVLVLEGGSGQETLRMQVGHGQKLHPFERILLQELFKNEFSIKVKDQDGRHSGTYWSMATSAYNELLKGGVFDPRGELAGNKVGFVFLISFVLLFVLFATGNIFPGWFILFSHCFACVGIQVAMRKRSRVGAEYYKKARGFKDYILATLRDRVPFYESEGLWDELLPYAVVFKMSKKYDRLFANLTQGSGGVPMAAIRIGDVEVYDEIYPTAQSSQVIAKRLTSAHEHGSKVLS